MYTYNISHEADSEVFRSVCKTTEEAYPAARKMEMLIDVDGTEIQDYYVDGCRIRVQNDMEVGAVYVETELDLGDLFDSFQNADGGKDYYLGDRIQNPTPEEMMRYKRLLKEYGVCSHEMKNK